MKVIHQNASGDQVVFPRIVRHQILPGHLVGSRLIAVRVGRPVSCEVNENKIIRVGLGQLGQSDPNGLSRGLLILEKCDVFGRESRSRPR